LDLKAGSPLGDLSGWHGPSPWDIAQEAIEAGVQKLIVLDLAQVGLEAGVSTVPLCGRIKREFPHVSLITGGGIRHVEDLLELKATGIEGVLIASALHNGAIGPSELQQLSEV
jgi:phosphoribosylformimino-5-aminoimidazole carboxamide ribotide isomerase